MITQRVPAWVGDRTNRAIRLTRYLIDRGLITGPRVIRLTDRGAVAPIDALWS
jgi:hypothetical protein